MTIKYLSSKAFMGIKQIVHLKCLIQNLIQNEQKYKPSSSPAILNRFVVNSLLAPIPLRCLHWLCIYLPNWILDLHGLSSASLPSCRHTVLTQSLLRKKKHSNPFSLFTVLLFTVLLLQLAVVKDFFFSSNYWFISTVLKSSTSLISLFYWVRKVCWYHS